MLDSLLLSGRMAELAVNEPFTILTMLQASHTSFTARHVFTTKDRDGFDENVFSIDILLHFYPDGTAHGIENDGSFYTGDEDITVDHDLEGTWQTHEAEGSMIRFDIKRIRPAKERENEIPGDSSNYYSYPTIAKVAHL